MAETREVPLVRPPLMQGATSSEAGHQEEQAWRGVGQVVGTFRTLMY